MKRSKHNEARTQRLHMEGPFFLVYRAGSGLAMLGLGPGKYSGLGLELGHLGGDGRG